MPPNTLSEKFSAIVTIYKYFEAESEERHQSGITCLKEHCQVTEINVFSMYSFVNRLYFSILHRFFNSINMQQWRMIGDE